MVPIYFAMVVVTDCNKPRVFRKRSNLQFPSPIGTPMTVGDSESGIVTSYYHDEAFSDREEFPEIFYVFVAPHHEVDSVKKRKSKDVNIARCFGYEAKMFKYTCNTLAELGWEQLAGEPFDYLPSYL